MIILITSCSVILTILVLYHFSESMKSLTSLVDSIPVCHHKIVYFNEINKKLDETYKIMQHFCQILLPPFLCITYGRDHSMRCRAGFITFFQVPCFYFTSHLLNQLIDLLVYKSQWRSPNYSALPGSFVPKVFFFLYYSTVILQCSQRYGWLKPQEYSNTVIRPIKLH